MTEERDEAQREILLLKQISLFYKHKDQSEEKAIANKIFTLEQMIQKKDNIIGRLEQSLSTLKEAK